MMNTLIDKAGLDSDLKFQTDILPGVSRTFALNIPQLPAPLSDAVCNAYLLCRIADTIEDEPTLSADQKHEYSERLLCAVERGEGAASFGSNLNRYLTSWTPEAERNLVANTARVIRVSNSLSNGQRLATLRCLKIMTGGMSGFQSHASLQGLDHLRALDRYCYHVAGVVGEMLTEIFCDYSNTIRTRQQELLDLSASFGQGLQMTNILKDIWEDRGRGVCWLPRSEFMELGCDIGSLAPGQSSPGFVRGINRLVGITAGHLENALRYTLLIPAHETGVRRFCLWPLGLAILTLRRIHNTPEFQSGSDVKISRREVKLVLASTSVLARSDLALKLLFAGFRRGLPRPSGVN